MSDIRVIWNSVTGQGDWNITGNDLESGADLESAVLLSLFTDAAASDDDVIPDGTTDRRGWWADPSLGSRLWLLSRAKQTSETLQRARGYIVEALQWLIDDGVAIKIDVMCEWSKPGFLGSLVTIYRSDGSQAAISFDWAWKEVS